MDAVSDVTKMREVLSNAKESTGGKLDSTTNDASGMKKDKLERVKEGAERNDSEMAESVRFAQQMKEMKTSNINNKMSTRGNVRFTENESIDVTAERRNSMIEESVGQPIATEMTQAVNPDSKAIKRNADLNINEGSQSKSSRQNQLLREELEDKKKQPR